MRGWAIAIAAGAGLAALPAGLTAEPAGLAAISAMPPGENVKAGADVKAGVDAWAKGDFDRAVEEWRGPAIAGDADAQFNLAQAYKLGRGVPIDPVLAESWFRKAAAQGHLQAEDNYGLALFQDDKKAEAVPWLEKSVARFEPRAQLVLGTMLFNGDAVKRDYPRAYALMTRASASGLQSASTTLAQMDQYITPADRERGVALARQYEAQSQAMPRTVEGPSMRVSEGSDRSVISAQSAGSASAPARVTAIPPRALGRNTPTPSLPAPAPVPAPRPARETAAPSRVAATSPVGSWRIQLGAFRDRGNAEALWRRLAARMKGASPSYVADGGVTRLQAGNYPSRVMATNACGTARSAGAPCFVVAP